MPRAQAGRGDGSGVGVGAAAPRDSSESEQRGVAAGAAAAASAVFAQEEAPQPSTSSRVEDFEEPNLWNPINFVKDRLEADPRYLQKVQSHPFLAHALSCVPGAVPPRAHRILANDRVSYARLLKPGSPCALLFALLKVAIECSIDTACSLAAEVASRGAQRSAYACELLHRRARDSRP